MMLQKKSKRTGPVVSGEGPTPCRSSARTEGLEISAPDKDGRAKASGQPWKKAILVLTKGSYCVFPDDLSLQQQNYKIPGIHLTNTCIGIHIYIYITAAGIRLSFFSDTIQMPIKKMMRQKGDWFDSDCFLEEGAHLRARQESA